MPQPDLMPPEVGIALIIAGMIGLIIESRVRAYRRKRARTSRVWIG